MKDILNKKIFLKVKTIILTYLLVGLFTFTYSTGHITGFCRVRSYYVDIDISDCIYSAIDFWVIFGWPLYIIS